jgi:hypothetical protein
MPSDFNTPGGGLRPIPSLIDLPRSRGVEVGGIGSGVGVGPKFRGRKIKLKNGNSSLEEKGKNINAWDLPSGNVHEEEEEARDGKDGLPLKHYDADGE